MRRAATIAATTTALLLLIPSAALACGGLIAANGAVRLVRTTTLAGYADGVEHYVTSFAFQSPEESFGSIIPLPDVPTDVVRGGDWTLQRLEREVSPVVPLAQAASVGTAVRTGGVEVLLETQVDALDITVVRGGGTEVAEWATEQGFELSDDAPEVFEFYAQRSPVFMAARFDASRAADENLTAGDGIPVHLTIPTDDPWVPLRILGLGKPAEEVVEASVFLLTPQRPDVLAPDGVTLSTSRAATGSLLVDLRSDVGGGWVPQDAWLSHYVVDTPAGALTADLAVSVDGPASFVDAGTKAPWALDPTGRLAVERLDPTLALLVALGAAGVLAVLIAGRRSL